MLDNLEKNDTPKLLQLGNTSQVTLVYDKPNVSPKYHPKENPEAVITVMGQFSDE